MFGEYGRSYTKRRPLSHARRRHPVDVGRSFPAGARSLIIRTMTYTKHHSAPSTVRVRQREKREKVAAGKLAGLSADVCT
jgi:hypothetical protein